MKLFLKNLAISFTILSYLSFVGGSWALALLYHWQFGILTVVLLAVGGAIYVTLREKEEAQHE